MRRVPGPEALVARLRSLWRGLHRRERVEAEMAEEFRHHLALRTEDLMRQGVAPAEAARRARLEFGHMESVKEEARASRGLRLFDETRFSWLDVKLGLRMLRKYPGLSLVSVVGMAVAIAIGAGGFGALEAMLDTTLPLPRDERIVSIQNLTPNPGNPDRRALHDFVLWRSELSSVRDLSAFAADSRNLITTDGRTELVRIAVMTASGFRVAGVPPLLGRPLLAEDEAEGAPPVMVLGHDLWQRRFRGDPGIIGRPVRLGGAAHTVVGVMPDGYAFPVHHEVWIPLGLDPTKHARGAGPELLIFGRLVDGVTMEEAQAELTTIGARMAAEYPDTHGDLRPRILPYTRPFFDIDSPAMALAVRAFQLAVSLLLVVVAVNVAILIYARTATRTGEIAVRTAIGASRRRVVAQLFIEALVLSAAAAAIGLVIAGIGLDRTEYLVTASGGTLPFWFDLGLSGKVVLYTVGLTVLAGIIIGVVPALKATGGRLQPGLQQLSSRGSSMQLGRTWTALIVLQVAIAVAILPFALYIAGHSVARATTESKYPTHEFLQAWLSIERDEASPAAEAAASDSVARARFRATSAELARRLEAEPAVAGVTFATRLPGYEWPQRIEIEGGGTRTAFVTQVAPDLFRLFDVPVLAGRDFVPSDTTGEAHPVIVDRIFAEDIFGGRNVLGRRIRYAGRAGGPYHEPAPPGPWLEIVGVVPAFTIPTDFERPSPKLYRPLSLADAPVLVLAVRVRGGPAPAFAPRLREITAAVDPTLQLHELQTAAAAERLVRQSLLYMALAAVVITGSVLLLSAAGIYAMMSFTVARRRREIGIRSALGAAPGRVIRGIFARAGAQLGIGALAGLLLALAVDRLMGGGPFADDGLFLVPIVAAVILLVGLLAALGPARRVLKVQPTEALREE